MDSHINEIPTGPGILYDKVDAKRGGKEQSRHD